MPVDPYSIVLRDGKKVDALTDGALKRAEKILGRKITVIQGGLNAGGVAASAGTHDGLGVIDTQPWDRNETVIALRAVGFAAWYRPTIPGLWSAHIHAVLIGDAKLAPSAARQVEAYLARRNGLADNAIDTDPGWTNIARYTAQAFHADVERAKIDVREVKIEGKVARLKAVLKRIRARRRGLPR